MLPREHHAASRTPDTRVRRAFRGAHANEVPAVHEGRGEARRPLRRRVPKSLAFRVADAVTTRVLRFVELLVGALDEIVRELVRLIERRSADADRHPDRVRLEREGVL